MKKEILRSVKRFWHFLWNDDSWFGWIFSVIFLFLFAKFLFFPFLNLVTGTTLPLAIVESCSMFHNEGVTLSFDSWWDARGKYYSDFSIDRKDFSNFWMKNGFNKGDILLIVRANPKKLKVGDIIVFDTLTKNPVIHRIVEISEEDGRRVFSTLGDNNNGQISFEKRIFEEQIVGKPLLKVAPYLGWVKLIFYERSKSSNDRGFCHRN